MFLLTKFRESAEKFLKIVSALSDYTDYFPVIDGIPPQAGKITQIAALFRIFSAISIKKVEELWSLCSAKMEPTKDFKIRKTVSSSVSFDVTL